MIWVVGSGGMLGTQLCKRLMEQGIEYCGTDRELSFLDPDALSAYASGKNIRAIVNCAAYTAVDKAESEPQLARSLNVDGPVHLARLCASIGARFVHVSTDYVFSGSASSPYTEDMATDPQSVYGQTKADGEAALMRANPHSVIVRTAWLYGAYGPNFVFTMLKLMAERDSINVVNDQHGCPTWASGLANALVQLASRPQVQPGIYHYTDSGPTTWYHFALEIHSLALERGILKRPCTINPIPTSQYPTKAARPAYSVLSTQKIQNLGIPVRPWQENLKQFMEEMDDGLAESSRIVDATKEFIVWAKKQSKSPLI